FARPLLPRLLATPDLRASPQESQSGSVCGNKRTGVERPPPPVSDSSHVTSANFRRRHRNAEWWGMQAFTYAEEAFAPRDSCYSLGKCAIATRKICMWSRRSRLGVFAIQYSLSFSSLSYCD